MTCNAGTQRIDVLSRIQNLGVRSRHRSASLRHRRAGSRLLSRMSHNQGTEELRKDTDVRILRGDVGDQQQAARLDNTTQINYLCTLDAVQSHYADPMQQTQVPLQALHDGLRSVAVLL